VVVKNDFFDYSFPMKIQIQNPKLIIPGMSFNVLFAIVVPILYHKEFVEHSTHLSWIVFIALFTVVLWYSTFKKMLHDYKFVQNAEKKELRALTYDEYLSADEVPVLQVLEDNSKNRYHVVRLVKADIQNKKFECYVQGKAALISDYAYWTK
jgi:hypothetical protein